MHVCPSFSILVVMILWVISPMVKLAWELRPFVRWAIHIFDSDCLRGGTSLTRWHRQIWGGGGEEEEESDLTRYTVCAVAPAVPNGVDDCRFALSLKQEVVAAAAPRTRQTATVLKPAVADVVDGGGFLPTQPPSYSVSSTCSRTQLDWRANLQTKMRFLFARKPTGDGRVKEQSVSHSRQRSHTHTHRSVKASSSQERVGLYQGASSASRKTRCHLREHKEAAIAAVETHSIEKQAVARKKCRPNK